MRQFTLLAWIASLMVMIGGAHSASADGTKGTYYSMLAADPSTLNPITSTDKYSTDVQSYVVENLLSRNIDTWEWIPRLAKSWTISKDGKVFTFKLREGVKWDDGQPLTAEDVKYSFDVYYEGRFKSPNAQIFLDGIKEAKIIDPMTVQFTTKRVYFKNFDEVATLTIIPKHFYGAGDPSDPKFNRTLIGTGPYILDEWVKGQKVTLKRNPNYWGNDVPYWKDRFFFQRVFLRIVKEEAVSLELLKKGDIDSMTLTPEQYTQKTQGPEWGKKIIAVKGENSSPNNFSYAYIGWNEQNPLFKDKDVRMAMSHLINRDFMIKKFLFNMSEKAVGPFGNRSPASSPRVKAVTYDPKAALELLKKSGWTLGPNGLVKTIDGKEVPFSFTLIAANPDVEKYLTVIKEDMKKVGITLSIKMIEWNSFLKLLDDRKFDAACLGWAVNDLEPDPKQMWHSDSIPSPGQNFISYSNPEVDKLIDEMRASMNAKKRVSLLHKIHEIIAADQPYSFLFNRKYYLYAHNARIKIDKPSFKYGVDDSTWKIGKPEE